MTETTSGIQAARAMAMAGAEPPPACPHCGGKDLARAGVRKLKSGVRQLYRCNGCFRRFSNLNKHGKRTPPKAVLDALALACQSYPYQVHLPKLNACPLDGLKSYLLRLPEFIDHSMFDEKAAPPADGSSWDHDSPLVKIQNPLSTIPHRASELVLARNEGLRVREDSSISKMAALSLQFAPGNRDRHPAVEQYFLACDRNTLAVEIPVYFFHKSFGSITGHIDICQFNFGKIWILDYKPEARKENADKVITQLSLYAAALHYRANIELNNIVCAYFDEHAAYEFEPERI